MHHLRPAWFEEPVAHTNIGAMIEVARRSPVPIATGESLSTKQQFAELLQQRRAMTIAKVRWRTLERPRVCCVMSK